MALDVSSFQKTLEEALLTTFAKEFPKETVADPTSHKRMATAIAEAVALVVVQQLLTAAEVLPGIPTSDSPTIGPGKIV